LFAVPAAGLKFGHVPETGFFAASYFFHQGFHNFFPFSLIYTGDDPNALTRLTRLTQMTHLPHLLYLTRMPLCPSPLSMDSLGGSRHNFIAL
jgi:hypothetical protein